MPHKTVFSSRTSWESTHLKGDPFTMEVKSSSEIESRIKLILISDLEIEPERLSTYDSDTHLLGKGIGLDSIETLTLAAGIEREFGIEIEDAELTPDIFETIGSLVSYVFQKRSKEKLF